MHCGVHTIKYNAIIDCCSTQAAAFTLGGNYSVRALTRAALSIDLRAKALAVLYPGYIDRCH